MSEKKKDEKPVEDKKCKDSKCCKHEKNGSKDCKNAASKEAKEDFEDKYIRLMAEFQNFKKRNEKEKSAIYKLANFGYRSAFPFVFFYSLYRMMPVRIEFFTQRIDL